MYQGPVIDSHVHLIDPALVPLNWIGQTPTLNRAFGMPEFERAVSGIDVQSIVFVEADAAPGRHIDEALWVRTIADKDPRIAAIIPHAPLEKGEQVEADLVKLCGIKGVRGVRRLLQDAHQRDLCLRDEFIRGVQMLAAFDLHFEICIYHDQIEYAARLVKACPAVRFVLNHIGKPRISDGMLDPWRAGIDRIAAAENSFCKFSGMVTEADHDGWQVADLRPYTQHILQAFGPERLIYGGDWPVVTLASEYRRWFETASNLLEPLSAYQRQRVFYDNAAAFYHLDGV